MTAFSKKDFINSPIFVKQNAKYSTAKYCYGIQGTRHIIMAKGLSISGLTINLNENFIRLIYYQEMLVTRYLKKVIIEMISLNHYYSQGIIYL